MTRGRDWRKLPDDLRRHATELLHNGMSQAETAAWLGMSKSTVGDIARNAGLTTRQRPKTPRPRPEQPASNRGPDLSWMVDAACGGIPGFTELPIGHQRAVCYRCPVFDQCDAYAELPGVVYVGQAKDGPVFAGRTGYERRQDERQQRRTGRAA